MGGEDKARLAITFVVLVGGAALVITNVSPPGVPDAVVALWGLVIGWWFPRRETPAT